MEIRRAHVVIMPVSVMGTMIFMPVSMVMARRSREQEGACDVHGQADYRNDGRFAESNRYWIGEPHHGRDGDAERDHQQDQGGSKSGKIPDLTRAERILRAGAVLFA